MNLDIAAGQTLKGTKAATSMAIAADPTLIQTTQSAADSIKNLSEGSKFFKGASKVVKFTADHINPIICLTSGIKVLGSDDKMDAAARECISLPLMFAAEGVAKRAIGMPYSKNGQTVLRKAFFEKQLKALDDYCATKQLFNKISLKYAPGIARGLFFVCASIGGYKLGTYISDKLLGKQEAKKEEKNS